MRALKNLISVVIPGVITVCFCSSPVIAQDSHFVATPNMEQLMITAPPCLTWKMTMDGVSAECATNTHELWLKDITHWRMERRIRIGYDDARYNLPALRWAQSSFIQPQMMVEDRYFYNPQTHKYTVDRYLDDLQKRYGGIDAVLIWPTYPNIGIDNRNQLDMIASMPGGLSGVKQVVEDFHRRGVRVLLPIMMWDQGTHDPGRPWPEVIAEEIREIGADGINGDTQDGVPLKFSQAADKVGHPIAFQPEIGPHDEGLAWNVLTWGQYHFDTLPAVDRYKWLETRHMVNISDRWNRNKTDDLQYAFFNGVGWESWENIWGIWNGISPRDSEALRRMATLERDVAPFLVSPGWEPFYPANPHGVFASRWPLNDRTVWTVVSRNEYDVDSARIQVPYDANARYIDLYHGIELTPQRDGASSMLSFDIEAHGFGLVMELHGEPDSAVLKLMATMKAMTQLPLTHYSHENQLLTQELVKIDRTQGGGAMPSSMVKIPGGEFTFEVQGVEVEGDNDVGVDTQYPWETSPRRFHLHAMQIAPFYMDRYPVSNAEFKTFLAVSHYQPEDKQNFLRDWKGDSYPEGWANKPVTWVSIEDARAYAKWAAKRLPHEWEWQYAAQGADERSYPWGDRWETGAVPVPDEGRTMRGPDDVDAHASGASPFGVMDMTGNVWQWTDEYQDEHTRTAILRGGSYYQPQGSLWYFPQAYRNTEHGKLLLMAPGKDRSATLGFRCVRDEE